MGLKWDRTFFLGIFLVKDSHDEGTITISTVRYHSQQVHLQ